MDNRALVGLEREVRVVSGGGEEQAGRSSYSPSPGRWRCEGSTDALLVTVDVPE